MKKIAKEYLIRSKLFLEELHQLYQKHGISIGHEDYHGSFILHIDEDIEENFEWVSRASIESSKLHMHEFSTGWAYTTDNMKYTDL